MAGRLCGITPSEHRGSGSCLEGEGPRGPQGLEQEGSGARVRSRDQDGPQGWYPCPWQLPHCPPPGHLPTPTVQVARSPPPTPRKPKRHSTLSPEPTDWTEFPGPRPPWGRVVVPSSIYPDPTKLQSPQVRRREPDLTSPGPLILTPASDLYTRSCSRTHRGHRATAVSEVPQSPPHTVGSGRHWRQVSAGQPGHTLWPPVVCVYLCPRSPHARAPPGKEQRPVGPVVPGPWDGPPSQLLKGITSGTNRGGDLTP